MTRKVLLADAIGLEFGFPFKSQSFNADSVGLPLVRIRDVVPGSSNTYYNGDFDSRYLVNDGDYLIGMDGEFNIGRWRGGKALLNQRVAKLGEPAPGVDRNYVARFLPTALKAIEDQTPFVTVKHLSAKGLRSIEVPLPPLGEQRRIAAILDQVDALRATRRRVLFQVDELSRSIFFDMFGNPMSNPKGWPVIAIERVCDLVRGSSPRPQGDPRFFGGPVPRLMISDITRDGKLVTPRTDSLTIEGAKRSRPCPSGTVVMAVSGNIGLASMLAVDACIHDGFVGFTHLDEAVLLPRFLLEVLSESKAAHDQSQAGAIFKNITTTDIKRMEIISPPLDVQVEFINRVRAVEHVGDFSQRAATELDALSSSVHTGAFAGEI